MGGLAGDQNFDLPVMSGNGLVEPGNDTRNHLPRQGIAYLPEGFLQGQALIDELFSGHQAVTGTLKQPITRVSAGVDQNQQRSC